MKTIISLIFLVFLINGYEFKCIANTANWCESVETAMECNVLEQCQKFVWPYVIFNKNENKLNNGLVNFTLYYETLCPDCREFVSTQLWNAFLKVGSIMNLTLVPYGNAKETYRQETKLWQFTCQHGVEECWGNLLHSCLIKYYPRQQDHFPFIYCMESNNNGSIEDIATQCAAKLNINMDNLTNCMYSVEGNVLQHAYAVMTDNLNPPHTYVPWITLNGVHNDDIQNRAENDLIGLICDSYQGTKPSACNKLNKILHKL